jgi:hypothetical protein
VGLAAPAEDLGRPRLAAELLQERRVALGPVHVDGEEPAHRPEDDGQPGVRPAGEPPAQLLLRGQPLLKRLPLHARVLGARELWHHREPSPEVAHRHLEDGRHGAGAGLGDGGPRSGAGPWALRPFQLLASGHRCRFGLGRDVGAGPRGSGASFSNGGVARQRERAVWAGALDKW